MIIYIYFFIWLIEVINAVVVNNENEIIKTFSEDNNEITLDINSEIDILNDILIPHSLKKLSIIGNSPVFSKLNFQNLLYFDSNIEEIEIKNININGNLFFKNNKKITLNNVNLKGYIDSDFNTNSNEYFEIINLIYNPTEKPVINCINLSGNVKIINSNFYGNSSCQNRLIHFNGLSNYNFEYKESNFYGKYKCPFLSIEYASNAIIESSYFEKGYGSKDIIDGGYIKKKGKTIFTFPLKFIQYLTNSSFGV